MNNENLEKVIEINENVQSKKMSDYKFSLLETTLTVYNNFNKIECKVTDVINIVNIIHLLKYLINSPNLSFRTQFTVRELKYMFKKQQKLKKQEELVIENSIEDSVIVDEKIKSETASIISNIHITNIEKRNRKSSIDRLIKSRKRTISLHRNIQTINKISIKTRYKNNNLVKTI